jgi:hypothetical protein
MSATRTFRGTTYAPDHFEPETGDPQVQRRMRAHLEQIDYTAYACNREVIAQTLGHAGMERFQRLALAIATARARWIAEALAMSDNPNLTAEQTAKLTQLRTLYQELSDAYEGLRRMVERGYVSYGLVNPVETQPKP